MRVLIATLGSRGDVQPMVALAIGLRDRGHRVTFCGPTDAQAMVESRDLTFVNLGVDAQRFLEEHPDVQGGRARALITTRAVVRTLVDEQFRVIEPAAGEADLILGAGLVNAPSTIAEAIGLPYRFVAFGSMAIPSRMHPPYMFPLAGLPGIANLALWRTTDVLLQVLLGDSLNRHRRRLGLAPTRRASRVLTRPGSLLLAADPEISPPPLDYDSAIAVTGALRLPVEAAASLPPAIEAFLVAGPPPVYIGFGSMTDADPERTTRTLVDAAQRAGVRAIISFGWAGLGGALPPTCIACGEVSHDALFPRLAGIVHHGGAGTTATAARAGVPQLVVPHLLDQFYWANRIASIGIGPQAVARRSLTASRLAAGLIAMTTNTDMRDAARALGDRLRGRDGVSAAVAAIEAIASNRH
jgi:vancomycin aglycone glucosyltransferase